MSGYPKTWNLGHGVFRIKTYAAAACRVAAAAEEEEPLGAGVVLGVEPKKMSKM